MEELGGWLKIYRKLEEHPVWDKPDALKLFLWCLFRARWADNGRLKRGQFRTTRAQGAESTKMSPAAFYRWMQRLQELNCVTLEVSSEYTTVTVCHYSTYQKEDYPERAARNSEVSSYRAGLSPEPETSSEDNSGEGEQEVSSKRAASERPYKKVKNVKKGEEQRTLGGDFGEEIPPSKEESTRFDDWYALYPKKVDPGDAKRAYQKALASIVKSRRCSVIEAEAWLLDRMRVYSGSGHVASTPKKFLPAPSRWLNAEKYNEPDSEWTEVRPAVSFQGANNAQSRSQRFKEA